VRAKPGYIQGSERNSYYYQIESQYRREKYQNLYSGTTRIVTVDMFLREIGLFLWWFLWG